MESLLTPEDKKVLQRVSRILSSYGMKEGTVETEGFDYYSDFPDQEINVEEWSHFSNNYTVDIPPMLYPIYDKIIKYCQDKFYDYDIDTGGNEINYARADIDIDVKKQEISLNYWCSYYDVSDYVGTEISMEDDEDLKKVLEEIQEVTPDSSVTLKYNGSGDSGYIESSFENGVLVPAAVEDYCYRILENNHGGWEINEGSQGEFIFNIDNNSVTLEHQYNTEETSNYQMFSESFA